MIRKIKFEIKKIIKENKNLNIEEICFKCFLFGTRLKILKGG